MADSPANNPMDIGPYKLRNNLALAPMAGVTDRPFRELCKSLGAGLAASEMITSDTRLWNSRKTRHRLDHSGETEPRVVQIAGADPAMMAKAARINVEHGAQIIDLNMGCPAKKVCKRAAGSALMRDERLVNRILEAVVAAVDVPVTLKIRTGWDPENRNAVRIAVSAERIGIAALAVHGRTRACKFFGNVEYETIRKVKNAVNIPVFANGDIETPQKAAQVIKMTGADGIMIGRAAQGRPWIFQQVEYFLHHGHEKSEPPMSTVRDIMLDHLENLYTFYGQSVGVRIARKHLGWYCKGRPGGEEYRRIAVRADSAAEQFRITAAYFDALAQTKDLAA